MDAFVSVRPDRFGAEGDQKVKGKLEHRLNWGGKSMRGILDLETFLKLWGNEPDHSDRGARGMWHDHLDDWGGVIENPSEAVETVVAYFKRFGLGDCTPYINVNAHPVHGPEWIWSPVAQKGIPIPQKNAVGHAVSRLQIRAVRKFGADIRPIHPFSKGVLAQLVKVNAR